MRYASMCGWISRAVAVIALTGCAGPYYMTYQNHARWHEQEAERQRGVREGANRAGLPRVLRGQATPFDSVVSNPEAGQAEEPAKEVDERGAVEPPRDNQPEKMEEVPEKVEPPDGEHISWSESNGSDPTNPRHDVLMRSTGLAVGLGSPGDDWDATPYFEIQQVAPLRADPWAFDLGLGYQSASIESSSTDDSGTTIAMKGDGTIHAYPFSTQYLNP